MGFRFKPGDVRRWTNLDDVNVLQFHSWTASVHWINQLDEENRILSRLKYQDNHVVLNCDPAQMPRRRNCWSSWVYRADTRREQTRIGVTYWMNRLQNIPESDPLFVSLNPSDTIPDHFIYDEKVFRHPVFDAGALEAQREIDGIQGRNNTWYAGAYTRYGFHEDGFASAVRIASEMNRAPV